MDSFSSNDNIMIITAIVVVIIMIMMMIMIILIIVLVIMIIIMTAIVTVIIIIIIMMINLDRTYPFLSIYSPYILLSLTSRSLRSTHLPIPLIFFSSTLISLNLHSSPSILSLFSLSGGEEEGT